MVLLLDYVKYKTGLLKILKLAAKLQFVRCIIHISFIINRNFNEIKFPK